MCRLLLLERTFAILRGSQSALLSGSCLITCGAQTYDLNWIIDILVRPELSLDIHIAEQALFYRQFLPMCP